MKTTTSIIVIFNNLNVSVSGNKFLTVRASWNVTFYYSINSDPKNPKLSSSTLFTL